MSYSAEAVSNYLLDEARRRGIRITNLKLQKLLYFAQGFYWRIFNQPLFEAEMQAWTYGPVIPELYRKLKHNEDREIKGSLACCDHIDGDKRTTDLLDAILEKFGKMYASQLVDLSHVDGSPWAVAWARGKFSTITPDSMRSFFRLSNSGE